jgi:hypothetical protein
MKKISTFLIVLLFFSGCSRKNAFDEFKMQKAQELSISSLQNSKILTKSGEINGIFSAIYLNEVYPEKFNGDEYFFVYFYTKDNNNKMYNPKDEIESALNIKLNSKLPIKILKLPEENRFSHLVDIKNSWNRYYLVAFKKSDLLNLTLENGEASSGVIKYKKEY